MSVHQTWSGRVIVKMPQQVGILAVAVIRDAGARLAPDRLVADLAAEPLHALAVYLHAVIALEKGHQLAAAEARIDHVDFVQQAFDADVLRVFTVERAAPRSSHCFLMLSSG